MNHSRQSVEDVYLGYISIVRMPEPHAYRAGILITDNQTMPMECYITDPLRLDSLQTSLYGMSIRAYLSNQVFFPSLIETITIPPHLFFTDDKSDLAARGIFGVPFVYLNPISEEVLLQCALGFDDDLQQAEALLEQCQTDILADPFLRLNTLLRQYARVNQ
ncbi:MAG: hypothetical protein JW750_05500 [Anaerolineaceae bacterium]|nr:hypothetical protein [Anaerolineaceae bacterium]